MAGGCCGLWAVRGRRLLWAVYLADADDANDLAAIVHTEL